MIYNEDEVIKRIIIYESIMIPYLSMDEEIELDKWLVLHFGGKKIHWAISYHKDKIEVKFRGDETGNLTVEDLTEFKLRWM